MDRHIPLIRPLIPRLSEAIGLFAEPARAGLLSNFGTVHEALTKRLEGITGGFPVPTSTGTAAIETALVALGLEPGDRVLLPDFTHAGTLLAIVRAGLVPVLAGVDPRTWVLRPDEVEKAANSNLIEGVVVVSPFGYFVDTLEWEMIRDRTGLAMVFDFAGAFGTFPETFSPVCYSFHATKNLGVGEGGMVVFRTERQQREARRLINFDTLANRSIGSLRGSNHKMDELKASFLLAGLSTSALAEANDRIDGKNKLLDTYRAKIPGTFVPEGKKSPSLCVLGNLPANLLEMNAERENIVFKRYYILLSEMAALQSVDQLSVSDEVMKNCCALPSDVNMSETLRVIETVRKYL